MTENMDTLDDDPAAPDTTLQLRTEDDLPDVLDVGTEEEDPRRSPAPKMPESRPIPTNEQTVIDKVKTGVLEALKENQKTAKKWAGKETTDLVALLQTKQKMGSLTHQELDMIEGTIRSTLTQPADAVIAYRKSWKKSQKIQCLMCIITQTSLPDTLRRHGKPKQVPSLSSLAFRVVQSKKVPKAVLNVIYAGYIYPTRLQTWQDEGPVKALIKLPDVESEVPEYWYSHPEMSSQTGGLLAKSLDASHLLTHLRVRTSTCGFLGVSSEGWKAAARSNETDLSMAMVEDLIDKQSVLNARNHFSEKVEDWMRKHGYEQAAELTQIIREWYDAEDTPGISAYSRVKYWMNMRNLLLDGVSFSTFPPDFRYIKGIPIITFEGMVMGIDTKLQMYSLAGPYNVRTVGSLSAETCVGILQDNYESFWSRLGESS